MYQIYGITKPKDGRLCAELVEDRQFRSIEELAKFAKLPVTIVAKAIALPVPHLVGFIVRKVDGKPAPERIYLDERPFASERFWPYTPLGDFVPPTDGTSIEDALLCGYSYNEGKVLLNTCVPALKRCTRKEFNEGVDVTSEPGIIEARADEYYFRTRYTNNMPAKIDV